MTTDEKLWRDWERHYAASGLPPREICRDGVADPSLFSQQSKRLLFVFREPHDWPGGDLRKQMTEENRPKHRFWFTVGRWAAGVLNEFPEYRKIDRKDVMARALSGIAAINLKKISGGAKSWLPGINAYAQHDRLLLRRQVQAISPTLIIAAGTFDPLIWLLDVRFKLRDLGKTTVLGYTDTGCPVLGCRHPTARVDSRKSYRELKQSLLKSGIT